MADQVEGLLPGDRPIAIVGGLINQRLGESSLVLQRKVRPGRELRNGVLGEKVGTDSLVGHLPRDVLDAVLADIESQPLGVVRPCASRAVESAVLVVHLVDRARAVHERVLAQQKLRDTLCRPPPGRRVVIGLVRRALVGFGTVWANWLAAHRISIRIRRSVQIRSGHLQHLWLSITGLQNRKRLKDISRSLVSAASEPSGRPGPVCACTDSQEMFTWPSRPDAGLIAQLTAAQHNGL